MNKPLSLYACLKIAKTLNAELPGSPHVTAAQVHAIDIGHDRTESHPVWQKIASKLRERRNSRNASKR